MAMSSSVNSGNEYDRPGRLQYKTYTHTHTHTHTHDMIHDSVNVMWLFMRLVAFGVTQIRTPLTQAAALSMFDQFAASPG